MAALDDTAVFGFTTNVEFLRMLMEVPAVIRGDLDTGLIAREFDGFAFAQPDERLFAEAALLLDAASARGSHPWARRDGWRLGPAAPRRYPLVIGDEQRTVAVTGDHGHPSVLADDGETPARVAFLGDGRVTVDLGGTVRTFPALVEDGAVRDDGAVWIVRDAALFRIDPVRVRHTVEAAGDANPHLVSPMPGTVVVTRVTDGAHVEVGDPVVVVEAMKMEHVVHSTVAGTVALQAQAGDVVTRGQTLAVVTPDDAGAASANEGETE